MTGAPGSGGSGAMCNYRIEHDTEYRYSAPVSLAHHLAHLKPLEDERQQVADFQFTVDPAPKDESRSIDSFGNGRQHFSIQIPHDRLVVRVRSVVRLQVQPEPPPGEDVEWTEVVAGLRYGSGRNFDPASGFTFDSPLIAREPAIGAYAGSSFVEGAGVLEGARDLMHRIHGDFRYLAGSTSVNTRLREAFDARTGVCQDFAHIMICGLRSLGLAARYVSGYLHTGSEALQAGAAPLLGADASHAWVSVYCPRQGWLEFDPTNNVVVAGGHIRLAYGRDYSDVAPLKGVIVGGGRHELTVGVHVVDLGKPASREG